MSPNEIPTSVVTASYGRPRPNGSHTTAQVQHDNNRPYTTGDANYPATASYNPKAPPTGNIQGDDAAQAVIPPAAPIVRVTSTATFIAEPSKTVFVTSLPTGLTEDQVEFHLKQLFAPYANDEDPAVTVRRDRMSCLYAYVELASPEYVAEAIKQLGNEEFNGVRLRLEEVHQNCTVYVSRPGRLMTDEQLHELLAQHEPFTSLVVCKPQEMTATAMRRTSKTAAFVSYADRTTAERAHEQLTNALKDWYVGWEMPATDTPTPNTDVHTLFLGGLNRKAVTKELVRDRFESFGNIVAVDLILNEGDEKNRSAFAFVRFAEPYSAPFAIESENGIEWLGKRIRVQFCEPPEVKQRRRSMQVMYPLNAAMMARSDAMHMLVPNYYIMPPDYSQSMAQVGPTSAPTMAPYMVNAAGGRAMRSGSAPQMATAPPGATANAVNYMAMPQAATAAAYGWTMPAGPNMMLQYGGTAANPAQHYVLYSPPPLAYANAGMASAESLVQATDAMQNMRIQ